MSYLRKTNAGTWRAEYRDRAGHRHSQSFPTQREARTWAAEQERDVRRGRHVAPTAGRLLLREHEARWWPNRVTEATTAATDRGRIDLHVLPALGALPLDSITPSVVQGWVKRLSASGLAPATVRSCHQLLASMLDAARRDGLLPDNPARGVTLPSAPPGRETFVTREQLDRVVEHMSSDAACLTLLLGYTGMRWGEAAGLHVARLNLLRRRVDVVETLVETAGSRFVKPYPKSARSRTVPLTARLVDALAAHLSGHDDPLVFPGVSRHTWARSHLKPALEAAGVPPIRVHDLRHSCASWLVQDGVTLPEVALLLGHASISTTMRYAHLAPGTFDRVLASLEDRRRQIGVSSSQESS